MNLAHASGQPDELKFSVPAQQARIFSYLSAFEFPTLTDMFGKLASFPPSLFPSRKIESLLGNFANSSHSATDIARAILSLHGTRQGFPTLEDAEFIDTAVSAVKANEGVDVEESRLRALFVNLLGLQGLSVSVKATRVVLDSERHMHTVSICTDLRPVFDLSGSMIDGYLIMHTMKLEYAEEGDERELHMFIDNDDISALEETLARARRKAVLLRAAAQGANMKLIGEDS